MAMGMGGSGGVGPAGTGGHGRGSSGGRSGGGGDRGTKSQQQDRRNFGAARAAGNVAPGVRGGGIRAEKLDTRTLSPQTPGWGALGPRGPMAGWGTSPAFNSAMGQYNDRSWLDKIADFLGGSFYDQNAPNPLDPKSYAGGINHTSTNVPGSVASLAGTATGIPGMGILAGYAGSQLPGGNVYHGGDPALAGYNTGTGVSAPAPQGGGTGMGQWPGMQPGLMGGQPPATLGSGLQAPGMPMQQMTMPGSMLNVGGPSLPAYGAAMPGYGYYGPRRP